jgi:predicted site-specific integrase-resolvase
MKYGYARVSSDGQSIDAQVRQLKAAGARQVFREVASGAKTDRAQLRRVLAQLDASRRSLDRDYLILQFPSHHSGQSQRTAVVHAKHFGFAAEYAT